MVKYTAVQIGPSSWTPSEQEVQIGTDLVKTWMTLEFGTLSDTVEKMRINPGGNSVATDVQKFYTYQSVYWAMDVGAGVVNRDGIALVSFSNAFNGIFLNKFKDNFLPFYNYFGSSEEDLTEDLLGLIPLKPSSIEIIPPYNLGDPDTLNNAAGVTLRDIGVI